MVQDIPWNIGNMISFVSLYFCFERLTKSYLFKLRSKSTRNTFFSYFVSQRGIKGIGRNVGRTFEIEAYVEKKIGELQKNRVSRVSRGEALLILVKLKINLSNISFYLT